MENMDLFERINSFSELGLTLRQILQDEYDGNGREERNGRDHSLQLTNLIDNQHIHNPWFTPENVRQALLSIAEVLTADKLTKWTSAYPRLKESRRPVKVAVIMAGNIPLVGFHDFLSVLISGNNIIAKTSSKDSELIVFISNILCDINPGFRTKIEFSENIITGFDAVIATGSNNTSRYFEYYFGKYPSIIRRNRNSVAVLEGDESHEELVALGTDIFSYFGLGCRNVSKLLIPEGYDVKSLAGNWDNFSGLVKNNKYGNNYDFNKAVYLVNKDPFHDTGFVLLKEDVRLTSPVSVLHYSYYNSEYALKHQLDELNEQIQCIVGKKYIPFGKAQSPELWDYADETDTIEFLLKKNIAGIL
jgi:hypothetical protein